MALNTKFGEKVHKNNMLLIEKPNPIRKSEYPAFQLNKQDLQRRFHFEQIKDSQIKEMAHWKLSDKKGSKKQQYIKQL